MTEPLILDPSALIRLRAVASRVQWKESSPSTNTDLAGAAIAEGWPHLGVLLTDHQSGGRGRLGRVWSAPEHSSIAVSLLVRPRLPLASLGWISMLGGAALVGALRAAFEEAGITASPYLKWPNDVLVEGKKLCGILAELVAVPDSDPVVVLGFGLNTAMTPEQLPVKTATSLAVLGAFIDLDALLADLVLRFDVLLTDLENASGDAAAAGTLAAVSEVCATLGTAVRVDLPNDTSVYGTASALAEGGALVIDRAEGGTLTVAAGDVVHLRPATAI